MSKSILVIDTPKGCSYCKIKHSCAIYKKDKTAEWLRNNRMSRCPLQEGIVITKQQQTELLEALEELSSEIDWARVNISWEETYIKLKKALGGNDKC